MSIPADEILSVSLDNLCVEVRPCLHTYCIHRNGMPDVQAPLTDTDVIIDMFFPFLDDWSLEHLFGRHKKRYYQALLNFLKKRFGAKLSERDIQLLEEAIRTS